jgi:hypothetical protein
MVGKFHCRSHVLSDDEFFHASVSTEWVLENVALFFQHRVDFVRNLSSFKAQGRPRLRPRVQLATTET